jgi:hypothetical protein
VKTRNNRPPIYGPLLITLLLTVIAWMTRIDYAAADLFFNKADGVWFLKNQIAVELVYDLTPIPAFIIFGIAGEVVLGCLF